MYFDDVTEEFTTYSDIDGEHVMTANTDTYSVAEVKMVTPVLTDRIRVIPYSHCMRAVCLRVDVRGCAASPHQATKKYLIWKIIPPIIALLLTSSSIILSMTVYMYLTMSTSSQDTYSEVRSTWGLEPAEPTETEEPIYQEPMLKNIYQEDRLRVDSNDQYLVPNVLIEDPTYTNPEEIIYSPVNSTRSILSSVSTVLSSLEEFSVDSSSARSTPSPYIPSVALSTSKIIKNIEDSVSPICKHNACQEHIYSKII